MEDFEVVLSYNNKMAERQAQGGRGFGRTNQGNRQGGRGRGNRNFNYTPRNASNLKGACEELKDNVYTVGDAKQADRYNKTTESIVNYIQRTYDEGQDVKDALVALEHVDMDQYRPEQEEEDEDNLSYIDKMILQQEVKEYVARTKKYKDNMNKAYGLILGQCTQGVKNKLEARRDWEELESEHDPIQLLQAIKAITQDYQDSKYPIASIYKALTTLFNIRQEEKEGLSAYIKRFKNAQDIMEAQHGKLDLMQYVTKMDDYEEDQHDEFEAQAYNQLLAYIFVQGADPKRSGDLLKELSNDFALGADKYPKDVATAASAVANYKPDKGRNFTNYNKIKNSNNKNDLEMRTGFAQKGKNKDKLSNVTCFRCHQKGHYARDCPPENKPIGTTNVQTEEQIGQNTNDTSETNNNNNNSNNDNNASHERQQTNFLIHGINLHENRQDLEYLKKVALLDNQSTADIFCNKDYLRNIRKVNETLQLNTNGGVLQCNQKGDLPGYGEVWYDEGAIANIISMSNAEKSGRYLITYDPHIGFRMKNLFNGNEIVFKRDKAGLFATPMEQQCPSAQNNNQICAKEQQNNLICTKEASTEVRHTTTVQIAPLLCAPHLYGSNLMNTVEENKKLYTKRQVARAEIARKLYQVIGYPSLRDYKHIIQTHQIKNCPVTIEDINISEKIYGPDVYAIKGKTVRKKPKVVVNDYIEIPKELIKAHKGIILCADIMFIDQVPFLVTMSKYIRFITIRYIPDRKKETLMEALDDTFIKYNNAGFIIKELHVDPEFECLQQEMEINEIKVNLTAAEEHQSDIERLFRVIKERFRAIYHRCPFAMWPKIMIICGASEAVKWLNTFPPAGGISTTYSPCTIITGKPVDYDKHCHIQFGSYVQAMGLPVFKFMTS